MSLSGKGIKSSYFFLGGPGNDLPKGFGLDFYLKPFTPITNHYKLYLLTRKSGLPQNYTTVQMAEDYAEIIQADFGGKVHGVIGLSYGGMIMQHFCALYPTMAEKFIILSATHKISDGGRRLDQKYAELLSTGKNGAAMALIAEAIFPKGLKRLIFKPLLRLMGMFGGNHGSPTFAQDVLIEAHAEMTHDVRASLGKIQVSVSIVCGDQDYYFPIEYIEEMADLIPKATLKVFRGKGHDVYEDPQAVTYILEQLQASL